MAYRNLVVLVIVGLATLVTPMFRRQAPDPSSIRPGLIPNNGNASPGAKDELLDLFAHNRTLHCDDVPIGYAPHKSIGAHANYMQEITWNVTIAANSCVNMYSHCDGDQESTTLVCNLNTDPNHTISLIQPTEPIQWDDLGVGKGIFNVIKDLSPIQQKCTSKMLPEGKGRRVTRGEVVHGNNSWVTRWGHVGARKCGKDAR